MSDFEVRSANVNSGDSDSTFSSGSFWSPGEHADKLHLIASRQGRDIEVETKFGMATPAIADLVVVFSDDKQNWETFKEARVFPVALRSEVLAGGIVAGPVLKDKTKSGNSVWLFGDLSTEDAAFINDWVKEHLTKNDADNSYGLVGDPSDAGSSASSSDSHGADEGSIEPDEEPF